MVFKQTKDELKKMKRIANDLGLKFRYGCVIEARMDHSLAPCATRLAPNEAVDIDLSEKKRRREWIEFAKRFNIGLSPNDYLYNCGAGIKNFHITSQGRLNVCLSSNDPDYDLRDGNFRDGFYNEFPKVRAKKISNQSPCIECRFKAMCPACPGTAFAETGSQSAAVPYYCQITYERVSRLKLL
jgi:radical SAM protein with 4Fe4S-binding SPASM domain